MHTGLELACGHELVNDVVTAIKAPPRTAPSQGAGEHGIEKSCLQEFESLRERREFERRHLPFLKTIADFDICCEVGFHQLAGSPLTVKQLLLLRVAPPVTVFRRLERLCRLDVVVRTRSPRDRRVHEVRLTPGVLRLFASYGNGHVSDE